MKVDERTNSLEDLDLNTPCDCKNCNEASTVYAKHDNCVSLLCDKHCEALIQLLDSTFLLECFICKVKGILSSDLHIRKL